MFIDVGGGDDDGDGGVGGGGLQVWCTSGVCGGGPIRFRSS